MASETILMPVPLPPRAAHGLSSFQLVKLWEEKDPEAILARLAPDLRIIATGVPILADGFVCPIDKAFMARFPRLELIANLGVGYDNIDIEAAAARGEEGVPREARRSADLARAAAFLCTTPDLVALSMAAT